HSVPPQRWRHALCALTGPGASLLLSAACARLALAIGFATPWTFPVAGVCAVSAAVAGLEALMNLFPWRPLLSVGERRRSDGLIILQALFAPRQPRKVAAAPDFG